MLPPRELGYDSPAAAWYESEEVRQNEDRIHSKGRHQRQGGDQADCAGSFEEKSGRYNDLG